MAIEKSAVAKSTTAKLLAPVLVAGAICVAGAIGTAGSAGAADYGAPDICRLYGYAPHSADYRLCRMNARRYWTTGACGRNGYAAAHRDYCHRTLPPYFF